MSQEITKDLDGDRSFEDRVFARFDAIDASLRSLDARVQVLESRSSDTKPIWERALKEILETRQELGETKRELKEFKREVTKRLDQIQAIQLENRVDIREAEDRIERLESRLA